MSTESPPEEAPVKRSPNPSDPTLAEKDAHWACGHLPARPWCPVCVKRPRERGSSFQESQKQLEHGLPSVSMDYAKVGNEDDGQAGKKLLIGREDWSGHTFCHVVDCKVLGDHHMLRKF